MQALTGENRCVLLFKGIFAGAVDGISEQGVSDVCHMNTDLVGTSRFQFEAAVGKAGKPFQNGIVCYGMTGVGRG